MIELTVPIESESPNPPKIWGERWAYEDPKMKGMAQICYIPYQKFV